MVGTFRTRTGCQQREKKNAHATHSTSYANRRWRALSAQWLQQYPICVVCACQARYNQGMIENYTHAQRNLIVDHITPHRGDVDLFWASDNLETLCRTPCHDCYKQSHEKRGADAGAWFDWLRAQMQMHQAELHVDSLQRWIPEHIYARLR